MARSVFLVILLFYMSTGLSQSHGLEFSSHEVIPEKRTSLNLTSSDPYCLQHNTDISFDFYFRPNLQIYFGYIMRLITNHNQNIDFIYNQKLQNFNFVIGETVAATFTIDSAHLFQEWERVLIRFDTKAQEVSFFLNDRLLGKGKVNLSGSTCCRVFFGTNDFEGFQTMDIPPMCVRDIRFREGGKEKYYYPLSESQGEQALDISGHKVAAIVKNPVWIKPKHQNWQQVYSLKTKGTSSFAFNKKKEILYFVSRDSLYQLSFKNMEATGIKLAKGRDSLPPGNQSVFDVAANNLYNFYIDEKQVSSYDPVARTWNVNFSPKALTIFWHANKFLSSVDSSLYTIGGYGQLQYKNLVQRYHFPTGKWEVLKPGGDFFMPRYMAGLGTNEATDTAYIIGGYGSNTGDQTINPKYNYDLLAYSVKNNSFTLLYHLKEPVNQFCFANSLVIDPGTNDFYALTYPNRQFNSSLQLIKGSLRSPEYELMGDSIPYFFYDVESFADLFYCQASKKLVAVTVHTSKDNTSTIKVYTIDFPPNHLVVVSPGPPEKTNWWLFILPGIILVLAALFYLFRRRKKLSAIVPATAPVPVLVAEAKPEYTQLSNKYHFHEEEKIDKAAVYLFGRFEAFDKEGNDITAQFTPLLKELFLLILLYSIKDGKGISSEKLYEILWNDKPVKDAKNNYSVNIVKLKSVLDKIGEYHIGKESGKLRFEVLNDSIKIDYQEFVGLISANTVINKENVNEQLNILHRGSFLNEMHYGWLDDFKAEISGLVLDILVDYISKADIEKEAEFIIKITNVIFFFDQLNETALEYKCRCLILLGRHGMAKDAYLKFAKEYKENYGHEFEKTFPAVTGGE